MRCRTFQLSVVLLVGLALLGVGCGSSDEALDRVESDDRDTSGAAAEATGEDIAAFCDKMVENMQGETIDLDEDPEAADAAAQELADLAAGAPEQIRPALQVYVRLLEQLSEQVQQGSDDLDGFGEALSLMFDPEVIAASLELEQFLVQECGVDPDEADAIMGTEPDASGGVTEPSDPTGPPDPGDASADPGDITLDDLDDIEAANEGATWVDKVNTHSIVNDQQISLASDGSLGGPLSPEEAVAACDAVRSALEDRQPELEVEVHNDDVLVASGAAGVPCAPA